MNTWLLLFIAIACEVIATTALKASDGFSRLVPSVIVVVGYSIAFYFLSIVLKAMSVGIAYAIWAGLGIVLTAVLGWIVFGQKLDLPAFIGIIMIVGGVMVINLLSKTGGH